jgi:hypothetical protein
VQTFDAVIERLIQDQVITKEDGLAYSTNPHNMALRLSGFGGSSISDEVQSSVRQSAPAVAPAGAPATSVLGKY